MSAIETIIRNLKKTVGTKDFPQELADEMDMGSYDFEAVWEHSDKDKEDFEDEEYPYEGPDWDKAIRNYTYNAWDDFEYDFREKTKTQGNGILITRCLGVKDIDSFIEALNKGKTVEGYQGVGIYWSWDKSKADCHWSEGGEHVYVYGLVTPSSIDYHAMALANLKYHTGKEEAEVTLKEGAKVTILSVTEKQGTSIWEGKQTVRASFLEYRHTLISALKSLV